jgi:DNA-binding transcriptional ArsR family regulator
VADSDISSTNRLTILIGADVLTVNHLVYDEPVADENDRLDAIFHALSNRTRRALLARLATAPARVNELARPHGMSVNAISKHLFVLEDAGLIRRLRDGSVQLCKLNAAPMADADKWIKNYSQFWNRQLDQLAAFVEQDED